MPTMFATTTSRLDRFALRQLKGCAAEIIAATAAKNLLPTTGETNEALHDRTRVREERERERSERERD